ncbi:hypothetical protein [Bdellovibrio sp. HCB337]|uniref:hypothetical protein n=1 Tax=Bdellovibrio sp. HCB337 TaxID=3394358 RepID=UPI0039A72CF0
MKNLIFTVIFVISSASVAGPIKNKGKDTVRKPNQAATCGIALDKAKAMVDADGTVADEQAFENAANEVIAECRKSNPSDKQTEKFISAGETLCKNYGNQQSALFRGTCLLNLAKTISFATGT